MNDTGITVDSQEAGALIRQFGERRVWAVVSTYALDSFYRGLTYAEAQHLARRELEEPGRSTAIVLEIECEEGVPVR